MDGVIALVDHRYEFPGDAVSTTEPPEQNVVGPLAVMVAVGTGLTVTVTGLEVPVHPLAPVTITV